MFGRRKRHARPGQARPDQIRSGKARHGRQRQIIREAMDARHLIQGFVLLVGVSQPYKPRINGEVVPPSGLRFLGSGGLRTMRACRTRKLGYSKAPMLHRPDCKASLACLLVTCSIDYRESSAGLTKINNGDKCALHSSIPQTLALLLDAAKDVGVMEPCHKAQGTRIENLSRRRALWRGGEDGGRQ
ncbi:hypothetical protein Mapa_004658 [Marchantia paleacea]|nr:hypothetical protein Mapa_004658 [Marchantia paleacea]